MKKVIRHLLAFCFAAALFAVPSVVSAQSNPSSAPAKAKAEKKEKAPPKVDINTATKEQLAKLPGLDEATADKIIAARPFANKTQLKSKKLISDATYEGIKDLTVARQPKDPNAPKKESKKKKKTE
jgi:DNA uptake protein ComE-like DNA-binding protein